MGKKAIKRGDQKTDVIPPNVHNALNNLNRASKKCITKCRTGVHDYVLNEFICLKKNVFLIKVTRSF